MKVYIEQGDEPDWIALVYDLRRCGVKWEIRSVAQDIPLFSARDEEIKNAIIDVTSCFTVSTQWCAVYRILVDYCNYPKEITSFCRKIKELMQGVSLSYPCNYQSVQKALCTRYIFEKHYEEWKDYEPRRGERVFQRQMKIAQMLLRCLGIKRL